MPFKVALCAISLAVFALASPIAQDCGIRVDLPKRSSLTSTDGSFDHNAAILSSLRTASKHRQNLINFRSNHDHSFNTTRIHARHPETLPSHLRRRQASEPLTDQGQDIEWTGSLSIGSNHQSFVIDFDTGSSDLWVPSIQCSNCAGKQGYTPSASTSSRSKGGTFQILYADGSQVSGPIYQDTVSVAGVTATSQTFATATTISNQFTTNPADGVLGMAFQSLSRLNSPPFFQTAFSQGAVPSNVFSFKLSSTPSSSSLYLGGTDPTLYTGTIEYHAITPSTGYWQLSNTNLLINGLILPCIQSGFSVVLDSGSTLMYGPPSAVQTFYATIPGSAVFDAQNGYYSFPCNAVPSVAFSWGGQTWGVSAGNFNLGLTAIGSSSCVGALVGQDLGLGSNVWLLGDSFMKNVYTVFDGSRSAVGFAALA